MRRGREGGREKGEGGRAREAGEGGRGGREGGRERERERERERWTKRGWNDVAAHVVPLLAGCPRGLSALSTSAARLFSGKKSSGSYLDTLKSSDFYMRKEKLRLICGHFEKFGLISDKKKLGLISGTFDKVQTFL